MFSPSDPSTASKRRIKQQQLAALRDITSDVEEDEFVPYACFYDPRTIITKNGELCQTIKVTGLQHEAFGQQYEPEELRGLIRTSLKTHLPNDSFAVWLHTIRTRTSLAPEGSFAPDSVAEAINAAWIEGNQLAHQHVNEVFITIVHEGESASLSDLRLFARGLWPGRDLSAREAYLDQSFATLDATVQAIAGDLRAYGAERLGMSKAEGRYDSEQLRFLEKLINFVDRPMPVPQMDLSLYLTSGEITFAFNAMEVRTALGVRRFASILTLKEYMEASLKAVDAFLELPMEFIVTQCAYFTNPQKVLFEYQELYNYQRLSEDPDISRLTELTNIIESNQGNPNDFGEQQLTIFMLADSVTQLEDNIRRSIDFFAAHGMVAVREDIKFEETYWAQLPGNFVFVSRMRPTYTAHLAGFANLSNMPVGRTQGLRWGMPVTTFHTASGTPYYFNFHDGEAGHTCMAGPAGLHKTRLLHFLLSQSLKFSPHIAVLDVSGMGDRFNQALGGDYIQLALEPSAQPLPPGEASGLFNPFALQDGPENRLFLARWLIVLARLEGYSPEDSDKQHVMHAVAATYDGAPQTRHLAHCAALLAVQAPELAAHLEAWLPGGAYGHFFTAERREGLPLSPMLHVSLEAIFATPSLPPALIPLLLELITDQLDGRPAILVMEEGWHLLMHTPHAANVTAWLDRLTRRNAITVTLFHDLALAEETPVSQAIAAKAATTIFMPDAQPSPAYSSLFGLAQEELAYLQFMEEREAHFLVRQAAEMVVGELRLHTLPSSLLAVLDDQA